MAKIAITDSEKETKANKIKYATGCKVMNMIKKINKNVARTTLLVFMVLLMLSMQSIPVAAAVEGIIIRPDFPGKTIGAGETAIFSITIENLYEFFTVSGRIRYRAFGRARDWDIRFEDAERRDIHRVSIPPRRYRLVNVIVETTNDAPIGEHRIQVIVPGGSIFLFVYITEAVEPCIDIRSDVPGKMIEAGDPAIFSITIENLSEITTADHRIQYRAFGRARDWDIQFEDAEGRDIHRVSIPPLQSKAINLIVETRGDAPIGEHRIEVIFPGESILLFVYITETHEREWGTLMLTTVDRDGRKIRSTVSAYMNAVQVYQMMTTVAGHLSMGLEEGVYDIRIERAGYKIRWERDVRIRAGKDTHIGIVALQVEPLIDLNTIFHGKSIEAGDTATFPITIRNRGTLDIDHNIEYEASGKIDDCWDIRFEAMEKDIHRILIPAFESRIINLIVETPGDAPLGEHYIEVIFYDGRETFFVYITETHKGKPGTLMLTAINRDGRPIRGATVSAYRNGELVNQMMTTGAGLLSMDLEGGIYDIKIEGAGYKVRWERNVRIRVRQDTDIGIVLLESKPFAAEIRVDVPSKTITACIRPVFTITIENIGEFDDTFRLRTAELPHGWHARYMVRGTDVEVPEVFIRAGELKSLDLEIIPPHGIGIGEYDFISVIESSVLIYNEPLSLSIRETIDRGTIDMRLEFNRLRSRIAVGGTAAFEITVRNFGRGISLTDVHPDVNAPEGWYVEITPRAAISIAPGARKVFNVNVIPPADIVVGEYRIRMTVRSDQAEEVVELTVIVEERPFIVLFGVAILIIVIIGLVVMFKKFRRQ